MNDPPAGTTYIGRCVGKQLFISDVDEKKKKVEALVKIMAPASDDEPERVIGTFPSRPIKVISKPSKKRQSAKNLERKFPCRSMCSMFVWGIDKANCAFGVIVCINHGSTISLFHRLRSQTVSTKYLCVSGSGAPSKDQTVPLSWVLISAHGRQRRPSSPAPQVGVRKLFFSSSRISKTEHVD